MKSIFKRKSILTLIVITLSSLILGGCIEKNIKVDANELLPESIEITQGLDSYVSNVQVIFTSETSEGGQINMDAVITYHQNPFAYSNIQEITSTSKSPDNPLDKLTLSLLVKDGVAYTNNSVTGLWIDESDPKLIKEVTDNGDLFQSFAIDQFADLEVLSVEKNKATIKASTNNSDFLKGLLNSFDTSITGDVEMIIDIETKYIESFIYYPEMDGKSKEDNKITIKAKDFNTAPEVVIPEEALYE